MSAMAGEQDNRRPRHSGPDEPTIDAPTDTISRSPDAKVHLVTGSTPALSRETESLLRSRLRAAALVLFIGFAAFLIWSIVGLLFPEMTGTPSHGYLFLGLHSGVTLLMAISAISMCPQQHCSKGWLRANELVVFGAPALFFIYMQQQQLTHSALEQGYLRGVTPPWMALLFIYAAFIPNTWQRAAAIIGAMSVAPIAIATWMTSVYAGRAVNANPQFVAEHSLYMGVSAIAAVFGVHAIGRLRREVFEARQLGQYKLRRRLGGGGMGEVFLAEHQLMKRPCAIKIIRPERTDDPTALARFEREVRATAKLSHWNNIDIYDYGRTDDGTFYYVMEYLPGKSIAELVKEHGPMSAGRVIFLIRQICDALTEAHEAGLIHRDIKPANIFAAKRGGYYDVAKLLDFGLVKPITGLDEAQLTQTGSITGSPQYMSPEQAMGDIEPEGRSDIYSLGAVAYFMLTARPPFDDERPLRVLLLHATEPPLPPSQLQPEIPEDLERVILRCLAKKPEERFATPTELADALDQCLVAHAWSHQAAAEWWYAHGPVDYSEQWDTDFEATLEVASS